MDELSPTPVTEIAATPSGMSMAARLLNVFTAPEDVAEDIKRRPPSTANWLVPTLILCFVALIASSIIFSQESVRQQMNEAREKEFEKQVAAGKMPKEAADHAREFFEKYGSTLMIGGAAVGAVMTSFITPLVVALALWLVGTRVFKGQVVFLKALELAGLANMIRALESLLFALLVAATGKLSATPSLALAIGEFDPQNKGHQLLAAANGMTIWYLVVLAIGLARLCAVPFARAAAWLFGLWAVLRLSIVFAGLGKFGL
jgi:hypothetical protein